MDARTLIRCRLARLVLGGVTALTVGFLLASARGQQPTGGAPNPPQQAGAAVAVRPDPDLDQQINQAKEEIELLEMQLVAKRALLQIGEARLEEAKHWRTHYENLLRDRKVTEERYLAAKDDVLTMEAHVASEKCDVKGAEMRLNYARRRLNYGEFARSPVERRLAEVEQRLAEAESKIDLLQHDVGRLRREKPAETPSGTR
jgi:hypothetical protein